MRFSVLFFCALIGLAAASVHGDCVACVFSFGAWCVEQRSCTHIPASGCGGVTDATYCPLSGQDGAVIPSFIAILIVAAINSLFSLF